MLISFIQPQAATNHYYFYFMQMDIGSWVLKSLHSPKFSSQMFARKKNKYDLMLSITFIHCPRNFRPS